MSDILAPILDLPGVTEAADKARDVLGQAHRHRANRREWAKAATEAAIRAARASSALDGGKTELSASGQIEDPILAGAVRVAQALDGEGLANLGRVWQRAPLQALAKLHVLAASDLAEDREGLGRPRGGAGVGERLDMLAQLVTGGTRAPAPVVAAVVHGEVLALRPFGTADGIVARAASRLVAVTSGLDPHNLGVPEAAWLKRLSAYRSGAELFAQGTPEGVGNWVIFCCGALEAGGREALAIADAVAAKPG
ncbi:oxidoreductase [Hoyosella sp. YIM 151337]|uniref:oxidoreductase n=1 Tax=Hoyosella sp. YIM 151337 TaxID=2992742 RepID=UPI0022362693|nr:oxidoreductase [Hoyosella sp. YIM 151337]MCW4352719.1 oxidoreductase [Hoyosella sp. YIM 151337]